MPEYERGGTQKAVYAEDEVVRVPCPMCGSDDGEILCIERQSIGVRQCASCSLIYTSPRVKEPQEVYWGEHDKYLAEARLIFSGAAPHHRDANYLEELQLIERQRPDKGRLLDVGCNMGMLLRLARARGWDAVGVEPSPALHRLATEELKLDVYNCFLEELPEAEHGAFDVVALSDVFEHIPEPRPFLETVARFIRSDGLLYVKVPNARWNQLKQRLPELIGRRPSPDTWDSYEHVVHYSEHTLRAMLETAGFQVRDILIGRPVQVPVWQEYVGQYFQYPSPWVLDWRRHLSRRAFYLMARAEHRLRGEAGYAAPNLVAVARPA
jgi:2-polyprenyl-3-methyl-5-hydroxy-6-metoxy-1,4-benzoquinol methylase